MTNTKYNGWTNYATWRVGLETVDNYYEHYHEMIMNSDEKIDTYQLSKVLQDDVYELLASQVNEQSIAFSYANAFISDVNWYELAEHIMEDFKEVENVG